MSADRLGDNGGVNENRLATTSVEDVRVRRAPRIGVFLVAGGLLGAIGTFVLTSLFEVDPEVGFGVLVGYFMIFGVPFGVVLGAVVALVLDRIATRRARMVSAEWEHTAAADGGDGDRDAVTADAEGAVGSAAAGGEAAEQSTPARPEPGPAA